MERRLRIALGVLILLQAGSWPLAMLTAAESGVRSMPVAVGCWGALAALTLGGVVLTARGRGPRAAILFAVVCGAALLLAGGRVTEAGRGTGYSHPTLAIAVGLSLLVALESGWLQRIAVVAVFAASYLAGITSTLALGSVTLTSAAANVATLAMVPLVGAWLAGTLVDLEGSRAAHAHTSAQVQRSVAREAERTKQYRLIHDTVLSTLSALSRGSLDPSEPAVAQRLTADADYLRGLIATSTSGAGMFLVGELARATRDPALARLRVHQQVSDVPDELPENVRRALADSTAEALANVVRHSGCTEAWVTIVGTDPPDGQGVLVTITDRGRGFDTGIPRTGLGIDRSLIARVRDVGGDVHIDSEPSQGTTVELRWPA